MESAVPRQTLRRPVRNASRRYQRGSRAGPPVPARRRDPSCGWCRQADGPDRRSGVGLRLGQRTLREPPSVTDHGPSASQTSSGATARSGADPARRDDLSTNVRPPSPSGLVQAAPTMAGGEPSSPTGGGAAGRSGCSVRARGNTAVRSGPRGRTPNERGTGQYIGLLLTFIGVPEHPRPTVSVQHTSLARRLPVRRPQRTRSS